MADDLFNGAPAATGSDYNASSIEVLEGLEPVRRRPGMYIGGTDDRALHHLAAEVLDNAMDEAVAGHANRIEVSLEAAEPGKAGRLTISDNGRGIPVDEHPKFPGKSSLEVILTTLHSGGKFSGKAYATSGGLHGVGVSVVNALSEQVRVEVARDRQLYAQEFSRGLPLGALESLGATPNRRGTTIAFTPDPEIFGERKFSPKRLFKLARSKAYLFAGVEIRWKCAEALTSDDVPAEAVFKFPGGLADHLVEQLGTRECVTAQPFTGSQEEWDAIVDCVRDTYAPFDIVITDEEAQKPQPQPVGMTAEAIPPLRIRQQPDHRHRHHRAGRGEQRDLWHADGGGASGAE